MRSSRPDKNGHDLADLSTDNPSLLTSARLGSNMTFPNLASYFIIYFYCTTLLNCRSTGADSQNDPFTPFPEPPFDFRKSTSSRGSTRTTDFREYELDYPQLHSTLQTSTFRKPPEFEFYPYRAALMDVKCEKSDEGLIFPDQRSCDKYFICENGILQYHICPPVLNLNQELQMCDLKETSKCHLRYINLSRSNWRRALSDFYHTTEGLWVSKEMNRDVVPMNEVTTSTHLPIFTLANHPIKKRFPKIPAEPQHKAGTSGRPCRSEDCRYKKIFT